MTATNDDLLIELKRITALLSGLYSSGDRAKAQLDKSPNLDTELVK